MFATSGAGVELVESARPKLLSGTIIDREKIIVLPLSRGFLPRRLNRPLTDQLAP